MFPSGNSRKTGNRGPELLQQNHSFSFEKCQTVDYQILKTAKKVFLRRYQLDMEMQFTFDEMTTSLVSPAYFSSEEEEEMDVDLLSVSVEGTGRHSDDSEIEVIACYRHVPVSQAKPTSHQKMTVDLSGCVDDGFPEFPWNDLADLWPEEFQPTNVELGTGPNALGQVNNCPISQCSNLTPLVDTLLSPPHE